MEEEEEMRKEEEEENTGISCLMSVICSWKSNSLCANIDWKPFPLFHMGGIVCYVNPRPPINFLTYNRNTVKCPYKSNKPCFFYFYFCTFHPVVVCHIENWYMHCCQPQQILFVPSTYATCSSQLTCDNKEKIVLMKKWVLLFWKCAKN
jgi:hypothetical protein